MFAALFVAAVIGQVPNGCALQRTLDGRWVTVCSYRLADESGKVWTHADPVWLRTWVGRCNAKLREARTKTDGVRMDDPSKSGGKPDSDKPNDSAKIDGAKTITDSSGTSTNFGLDLTSLHATATGNLTTNDTEIAAKILPVEDDPAVHGDSGNTATDSVTVPASASHRVPVPDGPVRGKSIDYRPFLLPGAILLSALVLALGRRLD